MKRPSYHRDRDGLDVTMTPMIDVVFLLLIFFVSTASFQIIENVLPSGIAQAAGNSSEAVLDPQETDLERIVIEGQWRGGQAAWFVNAQPVDSLSEVRAILRALRRQMQTLGTDVSQLPVILDIEGAVPLGPVIDVYDVCRLEQYRKIQFTAPAMASG